MALQITNIRGMKVLYVTSIVHPALFCSGEDIYTLIHLTSVRMNSASLQDNHDQASTNKTFNLLQESKFKARRHFLGELLYQNSRFYPYPLFA